MVGQLLCLAGDLLPIAVERRDPASFRRGSVKVSEDYRGSKSVRAARGLEKLVEIARIAGNEVFLGVVAHLRDTAPAARSTSRRVGTMVASSCSASPTVCWIVLHVMTATARRAARYKTQNAPRSRFASTSFVRARSCAACLRIVFTSSPSCRAASALLFPTRSKPFEE